MKPIQKLNKMQKIDEKQRAVPTLIDHEEGEFYDHNVNKDEEEDGNILGKHTLKTFDKQIQANETLDKKIKPIQEPDKMQKTDEKQRAVSTLTDHEEDEIIHLN